jgi:chlorite dismutase
MAEQAYSDETRRQVVSFSFYRCAPDWRRVPPEQKSDMGRELGAALDRLADSDRMKVLTYSTAGLRADCDLMLWRICYSLEDLQEMESQLRRTQVGAYLTMTHSFVGMTRRSVYQIGAAHYRQAEAGVLRCGDHRYLMLHPLVKTRPWYQLPFEERQRVVREYIRVVEDFPTLHLNTLYSYGLTDDEFIVIVQADDPALIIEATMRMRETQNSLYILRDTPQFTAVQCSAQEMLEKLG